MTDSARAATGANLRAFAHDLAAALERQAGLHRIIVRTTGDAACQLAATATATGIRAWPEILRDLWLHELRYAGQDAYHITEAPGQIQSAFATCSGEDADASTVTGQITLTLMAPTAG